MERVTLVTTWAVVLATVAHADDWPTYQHDMARTGVTAEDLSGPLVRRWAFRTPGKPIASWAPPQSEPVEGYLERPRVRFDDAYHVAAVDGLVTFGSSADNTVYALVAATGTVRWTFVTGGLVDGKVVYFASGLFPHERIGLYAVRADDGTLVWRNDTLSDRSAGQTNYSLQGYLLASPTGKELFVPCGRATPLAFSRKTGGLMYSVPSGGRNFGGTYALLVDNKLFSGNSFVVGFEARNRRPSAFAWFPGYRLVVAPKTAYLGNGKEIVGLDRMRFPDASRREHQIQNRRMQLAGSARGRLYASRRPLQKLLGPYKTAVADAEARLAALKKQGKDKTAVYRKAANRRDAFKKKLDDVEKRLAGIHHQLKAIAGQVKELETQRKAAHKAVEACFLWRSAAPCADAMILAGKTLYAGGQGRVVAVDTDTGKVAWQAVADGRLLVSTDTGMITCFAKGGTPAKEPIGPTVDPQAFPKDSRVAAAAEAIVRQSGVTRGYCLVLGCPTGRLAGITPPARRPPCDRRSARPAWPTPT